MLTRANQRHRPGAAGWDTRADQDSSVSWKTAFSPWSCLCHDCPPLEESYKLQFLPCCDRRSLWQKSLMWQLRLRPPDGSRIERIRIDLRMRLHASQTWKNHVFFSWSAQDFFVLWPETCFSRFARVWCEEKQTSPRPSEQSKQSNMEVMSEWVSVMSMWFHWSTAQIVIWRRKDWKRQSYLWIWHCCIVS